MSGGDLFDWYNWEWECATEIWCVESRNAAKIL